MRSSPIVALLLLVPSMARAYDLSGYAWEECNPEVEFVIAPDTFPSSAGGATALDAALNAAVREWATEGGADVTLRYGGEGDASASPDGRNAFSWYPGADSSGLNIISTALRWTSGTTITDCDVVLLEYAYDTYAGVQYLDWDTSGSPSDTELDVQSDFNAEIGFCLGLEYVWDGGDSAMSAPLDIGTTKRDVTSDDAAGLQAIYGLACQDDDGDGYFDDAACGSPSGDCDDCDAAAHPGATETCNGTDDDCDGETDEDGGSTWYADGDGDGYGDPAHPRTACEAPAGYVRDDTDCDDDSGSVHPGATETCNGIDDDCDGEIDEGFDNDGDGYTSCAGDCEDDDAAVRPDAEEVCNGIDDDCDGEVDEGFDVDADGYTSCGGDCADTDPAVHPGATEVCNALDDDCDGDIDEGFDLDADTWTTCAGDCDDAESDIHPEADESCNGIDDDCDQDIDEGYDVDTDSYTSCAGDCDDRNPAINPGVTEICNETDDDCDGDIDEGYNVHWYADVDGDGFGDPDVEAISCLQPVGYVARSGDCDDTNADIDPGEVDETNGVDANCDGKTTGGVTPTDGCGCTSTPSGPSAGWVGALALAWLARRRRGGLRAALGTATALALLAPRAQAGTCDALRDPLLDTPQHDASTWPALLACAEERFAPLAAGCLEAGRRVDIEAASSWSDRPEVAAGQAGVRANRAAATSATRRELTDDAAAREQSAASGERDPALPGSDVPVGELLRLEDAAEPARGPSPPARCAESDARPVADLYDRFLAALPAVEDQVTPDLLCQAYADGAAARIWAGRPGGGELLLTAVGLSGAPCDRRVATLAADPRIAAAALAGVRSVEDGTPSELVLPPDAASWWLDGAALPATDGDRIYLSPGVHRIGHDGAPPLFTLADVPKASEVRVAVEAGKVVVTATPLLGAGSSGLHGAGSVTRLIRVGGSVGVARIHDATFGLVGLSVAAGIPRTPLSVAAAGTLEMTTEPIWLASTSSVERLLRAEVAVAVDPLRAGRIGPILSVGGYREASVGWGLAPRAGIRVDTRWSSIEAQAGVPIVFTGEGPGVDLSVTVRPGVRPTVSRRPS